MTFSVRLWAAALSLCGSLAGQTLINGDRTLQGKINYAAAGGSANALTLTLSPALLAYQEGVCVSFKAASANTASVTIDVNSLGAKTVKKKTPSGLAVLTANDIVPNGLYSACYDGTDMQLESAAAAGGAGSSTNLSLPAANCSMGVAVSGWQLDPSKTPTATCATGTSTTYGVLSFAENTSGNAQYASTRIRLSGTIASIDLSGTWRTSATSGDVVWQVQTACVADGETGDPSWNPAQTITDTAKGTALQWNDFSLTGLTLAGCSSGETLFLKVLRDATHGSDTLSGAVELIAINLTINR